MGAAEYSLKPQGDGGAGSQHLGSQCGDCLETGPGKGIHAFGQYLPATPSLLYFHNLERLLTIFSEKSKLSICYLASKSVILRRVSVCPTYLTCRDSNPKSP